MPIDRRSFVTAAGLAVPAVATSAIATAAGHTVDIPDGDEEDATMAINYALAQHTDVAIPPGQFRVDGTIIVRKHRRLTLSHGTTLRRLATKTDNTEAILAVLGNRASFSGGRIITENDHPQGIVKLGHADATKDTRYTATQWYFGDCWLEGRKSPGNIGLWIPNSQTAYNNTDYANYYGYVQNVTIRGSDIGILLDEVANGHRFYGVFFSHLISAAWELRGAYGNQIFGGFLHQSEDGVVAIRLRNTSSEKYHDSVYNSFFGFGIEPGGSKSSAYHIESRCRRNTLFLQSNVAGKSVDENGDNVISRHGGDWPVGA
jgi:hypothetical protein